MSKRIAFSASSHDALYEWAASPSAYGNYQAALCRVKDSALERERDLASTIALIAAEQRTVASNGRQDGQVPSEQLWQAAP